MDTIKLYLWWKERHCNIYFSFYNWNFSKKCHPNVLRTQQTSLKGRGLQKQEWWCRKCRHPGEDLEERCVCVWERPRLWDRQEIPSPTLKHFHSGVSSERKRGQTCNLGESITLCPSHMLRWKFKNSLKDQGLFWKGNKKYLTPYYSHACFHIKGTFQVACQAAAIALNRTISGSSAELNKSNPIWQSRSAGSLGNPILNVCKPTKVNNFLLFSTLPHWGKIFWCQRGSRVQCC